MSKFWKALIVLLFGWKESIFSKTFAHLKMRFYDSLFSCITHAKFSENVQFRVITIRKQCCPKKCHAEGCALKTYLEIWLCLNLRSLDVNE